MLGGWDLYTTTIRGWFWSIIYRNIWDDLRFRVHHILWDVYVLPLRCPCLFAWCWRKHCTEIDQQKYDSTRIILHIWCGHRNDRNGGRRCGVPWYMAGLWVTLPHFKTPILGIHQLGTDQQQLESWEIDRNTETKFGKWTHRQKGHDFSPSQFAQKKTIDIFVLDFRPLSDGCLDPSLWRFLYKFYEWFKMKVPSGSDLRSGQDLICIILA